MRLLSVYVLLAAGAGLATGHGAAWVTAVLVVAVIVSYLFNAKEVTP
jgi:hypothetical protein